MRQETTILQKNNFNRINNTTYDGIVVPTETVAFEPNQIKLFSDENPTENDDIRYSLDVPNEELVMSSTGKQITKEFADILDRIDSKTGDTDFAKK